MRYTIFKILSIFILVVIFSLSSCNKSYVEQDRSSNYTDSSLLLGSVKKVLYLVIDGANGETVKSLKLPNLNKLAASGIYTWNSLSGFEINDTSLQASWANLMTGVYSSLTKVTTTFDTSNLNTYPSFESRISSLGKKVLSYSSSSQFDKYFTNNSGDHKSFGDDLSTANALIESSKKDVDIMVGEFNSAYQAGLTGNFDFSSQKYTDALKSIDNYVGSIVSSIRKRPNYSKERWLYIITSTANLSKQEKIAGDPSAYGDPKLNTFSIISNDNFSELYMPKPTDTRGTVSYNTTALRFKGDIGDANNDGNRIKVNDSKNLYNCPPGNSITIEAKLRINPKPDGSYSYSFPPFLSKVESRYGSNSGWSFYRAGNNIVFWVGNGVTNFIAVSSQITDNNWHTFAGKIVWSGSQVTASIYVDGVLANATSISVSNPDNKMITNNSPLVIGYWPYVFTANNYFDCYIKDVRIWNTGLTNAQISAYSCYPSELLPTDLSIRKKLVGDFRIEPTDVSSVKDYSSSSQNGTYEIAYKGKLEWKNFDEVSNAICPSADINYYKATLKGVDFPYIIYTWLGLRINPSWNLSGKYWTPTLNNEIN